MNRKVVIGTRGSKLALWQTNWVKRELETHHTGIRIEIEIISTKGDRVLDVSLPKLGEQGKGLFTRELEEAMLEGRIDLAVHSLKDLPTQLPAGLHVGAICEREDVRDALVARAPISSFDAIPNGALIGTSSLRRQAQIRSARPDLRIEPIRGNVDTRLRKLDDGEFDAIILASAGLHRLGYTARITEHLSLELVLSAVGQGALAVEARADDELMNGIVGKIDHEQTRLACTAEREFLKGLGGGCLVPIAAHAVIRDGAMELSGLVAAADGSEVVRGKVAGDPTGAQLLGEELSKQLLARGAAEMLARG